MKKIIGIVFSICIFAFQVNAQTTVTISLLDGEGQDTYLASGMPNVNYGAHPSMGGNTWTCGGNLCLSRGLFKFDMSSVPTGATILNASLQLFGDLNWSSSPTTGGPVNSGFLSRVTSSWSEFLVNWNTQPSVSSSNVVVIPGSTSAAQDYVLNVTGIVQDIMTFGNNYGFQLRMQDEVNPHLSLMFAASDNANPAKVPVLTITYQPSYVGIASNTMGSGNVKVVPNPSEGDFNIECGVPIGDIVVFDLSGKEVLHETAGSNKYIVNSSIDAGVYMIQVYDQNGMLLGRRKLVKTN